MAEAEHTVIERGHSRLPVVGSDLDDVRGFIHAKDLLTLAPTVADAPIPARLTRRMLVVPEQRSLEDLLLMMRRTRVHFALVTPSDDDGSADHGRTAGWSPSKTCSRSWSATSSTSPTVSAPLAIPPATPWDRSPAPQAPQDPHQQPPPQEQQH